MVGGPLLDGDRSRSDQRKVAAQDGHEGRYAVEQDVAADVRIEQRERHDPPTVADDLPMHQETSLAPQLRGNDNPKNGRCECQQQHRRERPVDNRADERLPGGDPGRLQAQQRDESERRWFMRKRSMTRSIVDETNRPKSAIATCTETPERTISA